MLKLMGFKHGVVKQACKQDCNRGEPSKRMTEVEFLCPYCAQPNLLSVDPTGGRHQVFTVDCEVCCRPIRIAVQLDADGEPVIDASSELSE
jgi:hypothetical protein